MGLRTLVLVTVAVLASACASDPDSDSASPPERAGADAGPSGTTSAGATTAPPPMAAPTTTMAPPPVFDGVITSIDDATRARMTASWRPGCPVPLEDLRLLTLDHWGYDGAEHVGELVVHADQADAILGVFATLFDLGYPIEKVRLVDEYGGDDAVSTRDNNTAGFNCRFVVGKPGAWSEHAFGRAIDVNPLVNPYVLDPNLADPELGRYVDRSLGVPGMIHPGDPIIAAFAAAGWQWGGTWPGAADYQHFSATGR